MATKKRKKPARTARKRAPKRVTKRPRLSARRQPESLRLRSMAVSLTVNDVVKSIAWYRDVLGFTEGERWEENGELRGMQLKAGRCDLMLNQDDFAKGRDRQKGDGFRLWISTIQDLHAIAARIQANGGVLDHPPRAMPWGDLAFAITDPDGYKVTCIQEE